MKKVICPFCKEETEMIYWTQITTMNYKKINKDNTISKKVITKIEQDSSYGNPEGLTCKKCNNDFDFETDEKGRIIDIWTK